MENAFLFCRPFPAHWKVIRFDSVKNTCTFRKSFQPVIIYGGEKVEYPDNQSVWNNIDTEKLKKNS